MPMGNEYQKVFTTDDFDVIFMAQPHFRQDKEYYEEREEEGKAYYDIRFEIRPTKGVTDTTNLVAEFNDFYIDLKLATADNSDLELSTMPNFEEIRESFGKFKKKISQLQQNECEELMDEILSSDDEFIELDPNMPPSNMPPPNMQYKGKEKMYSKMIKQQFRTECWNDQFCEDVCEDEENCFENCHPEQHCEQKCDSECHDEETCENVCETTIEFNEETGLNESSENCEDVCTPKEVCNNNCWQDCYDEQVCEEICETNKKCNHECKEQEKCEEQPDGEIRINGNCGKYNSDINIGANGPGLDYFNELNNFHMDMGCGEQIKPLVELRKIYQKDINEEFARWYFEDFIGDDPEKVMNGGNGLRRMLEMLTWNENEISQGFHCGPMENAAWPEGFKRIEFTYDNENTHVEVWEKSIPVEFTPVKHWTTLYKYAWIPEKEVVKKLIDYKMSELNTIGPSAKDVAEIRSDEGKMAIINNLADKYSGSFDVRLELVDEEGSIAKKYLQINPDVAVIVTDVEPEDDEDISITIDYDLLYGFINYITFEIEGDKIQGPHWVNIDDDGGPGQFFSIVGGLSKLWREGVKIRPRYALFKMFFNTGDIISLMKESESSSDYSNNVDITEEPIINEGEMK